MRDAEIHHGETRGKRKTHKVCKKHVNFTKSGGFAKVGRNNNCAVIGRKCTETAKLRGMTKKRSSEILADENKKIGKGKIWKICH